MILIVSVYNYVHAFHLHLVSTDAIVGLELAEYFIEENDRNFVVSILLLEKTLSVPISLQLTTTDETASK